MKNYLNELQVNFSLLFKSLQEMVKLIDEQDYYNDEVIGRAELLIRDINNWLKEKN